MTVTKEFTFDAAHMLSDYEGPCSNLHGHTYKVEVTVQGKLNEYGMVVDFSILKDIVNVAFLSLIDHSFIVNVNAIGVEQELYNILASKLKVYKMKNAPTAENMARLFYLKIENLLRKFNTLRLISVRVFETATSSATYYGEEEGEE